MENEIKNSIQFIINKAGKKTGFSTPINYFDSLDEAINIKTAEENFVKKIAFKVPETYFNTIEDAIVAKVLSEEKETKVISFKNRILKFIPIAAAAFILLFIGLNSFVFNTNDEFTMDSLTDTDIEYWLDSNTLNTNDVATILEDDLLEENNFSFTDIKNESIEDYINLIDNTYILNELN